MAVFFGLTLKVAAALILAVALPSMQAYACPAHYFQCGSACCPGR
jgi:hypothetical protein